MDYRVIVNDHESYYFEAEESYKVDGATVFYNKITCTKPFKIVAIVPNKYLCISGEIKPVVNIIIDDKEVIKK